MLSSFIKQLRQKNNFTQAFVADKLGIARPTYAQIEHGERDITVSELEKLAELFDLSAEALLKQQEPTIEITVTGKEKITTKTTANDLRISVPQERLDKFRQVLLYILTKVGGKPNIGETAIYKLLYFIDFDYYEKYEEQLMGLLYIRNHHGPTPVVFKQLAKELIEENKIELINSKFYQYSQKKYLINPEIALDLSILNGQEKEHIDWELRRLSDYTATALSDLSHQDVPWLSAQRNELLDYEAVFYRTKETSVRDYKLDEDAAV